jgi:hypothetical protein
VFLSPRDELSARGEVIGSIDRAEPSPLVGSMLWVPWADSSNRLPRSAPMILRPVPRTNGGTDGPAASHRRARRCPSPPHDMGGSVLAAIAEDRPHQGDLEDNFVSFATTMAAIEAAETGRPVKVATE